jgi:WD40 repeat protein
MDMKTKPASNTSRILKSTTLLAGLSVTLTLSCALSCFAPGTSGFAQGTSSPNVVSFPSGLRAVRTLSLRAPQAGTEVFALAVSPNGRTLARGSGSETSRKGALELWDEETGKLKHTLQPAIPAFALAFSPDGKTLASVSGWWASPNQVRLWDVQTGRLKRVLPQRGKWVFHSVAFSPDGRTIAAGSGEYELEDPPKIVLWDNGSGQIKRILSVPSARRKFEPTGVMSVKFSPDGTSLAGASTSWDSDASEIELWDVRTGQLRQSTPTAFAEGQINDVAFSPNGKYLASVGSAVTLRDGRTGKLLRIHRTSSSVDAVAFAPNGRSLVTSRQGPSRPGQASRSDLSVWDLATGMLKGTVKGQHLGSVRSLAFSRTGRLFASGSRDRGAVKQWSIR